jgi:hypothetical protein
MVATSPHPVPGIGRGFGPSRAAKDIAFSPGEPDLMGGLMGLVAAFHTSSDEDGDKLVYHNQSECGYGKEIIKNGHKVDNDTGERTLCRTCDALAK